MGQHWVDIWKKILGANMFSGIQGKNVGPGQHRLHGPRGSKKFFCGTNMFSGILGKNVGPRQHGLHGPCDQGDFLEANMLLKIFGANMFSGILVKNVGAGQHRLHGPPECGEIFLGPTCFRDFWAKCWRGPTNSTHTVLMEISKNVDSSPPVFGQFRHFLD